jgi:DNA-binding transcriptional MerR regulator
MTTSTGTPPPQTALTIAEVAAQTGVTAHTLRYYERIGLLDRVDRDEVGRRRYGPHDLDRVRLLQKLRRTGMPLQQIGEFVRLIRSGPGTEPERLALLEGHRTRVAAELDELRECLAFIDYKLDLYRRSMR